MVSNRVMVGHWSLMLGRVWWLPTRTNWFLHEKDQNPKFVLSFWILIAVRVLNSIFQQWRISASNQWNTNGEPCTGAAIDSTSIDSSDYNPGIKCDCSYDNGSTCHITQLYVHVFVLDCWILLSLILNIVGIFPINAILLLDIWFDEENLQLYVWKSYSFCLFFFQNFVAQKFLVWYSNCNAVKPVIF